MFGFLAVESREHPCSSLLMLGVFFFIISVLHLPHPASLFLSDEGFQCGGFKCRRVSLSVGPWQDSLRWRDWLRGWGSAMDVKAKRGEKLSPSPGGAVREQGSLRDSL